MDINKVAEHILNRMPEGLSKIEKARYIYIELGKLVSFDEHYWLGNRREKEKIYKSSRKVKEFKDLKSNKIICVSLSELYNFLLNEIGIDAIQEKEDERELAHVYSVIIIDGKRCKADLQKDLKNVQAKLRTMHFDEDEEIIDTKELEKADKKIDYSYKGEKILKEMLERIEIKIKECESFEDKIKIILEEIGKNINILKMGYTEKMYFYEAIISAFFCIDGKNLCLNNMYRKVGKKKKYTRCLSVKNKDNGISRFIYSEKTGKFLSITDLKLRELIEKGLVIMYNAKIPGLYNENQEYVDHNR